MDLGGAGAVRYGCADELRELNWVFVGEGSHGVKDRSEQGRAGDALSFPSLVLWLQDV